MAKYALIAFLFLPFFYLRMQLLPKLNIKDGQLVKITGYLSDEPQVSGNRQNFKIGQFEIATERYPEFHYGEKIQATGKIREKYFLSYPEIEVVGAQFIAPAGIKGAAVFLRLKIREIFNRSFSKPYDGIVSGVVLGDKSLISKDFWDRLKITGTLHIMVASGSNIAMFSEGLLTGLCILFVRRISLLLLISLIWFYTLMAGFQPPIVRAAIMASLLYTGQFFGRESEIKRILWLTGIIMVIINPFLISDIGFQLSFLATAGLVYIQPALKNMFSKETPRSTARSLLARIMKNNNFSSSVSAQLATLPVLLLNFGQFNLLSPLINLAVLWTIPFILQAGMGLGIIGLIGGAGMARIFSFLLFPLLYYLEKIIDWSARLTFFRFEISRFGIVWVVVYYFILYLFVRKDSRGLRSV